MKIGIFDSGVGGLTVLNESLKILPYENYIYIADSFNVPYGIKSKKMVKSFIFNIVGNLENMGIDALLIACNTATSIGVNELREKYDFPIVGMEPAVKYALEKNKEDRILVLATPLTLKEDKYNDLVKKHDYRSRVDSLALPELVDYAESYTFDNNIIIKYLSTKFRDYNMSEYSSIVLGCTHFIYYRDHIKKLIGEEIKILDGNRGTIKHLNNLINNKIKSYKQIKEIGKIELYKTTKNGIVKTDFSKYMNLLGADRIEK